MAGDNSEFKNAEYPVYTADMAVSHRYDRNEISKGELPRLFAECCTRGPTRARPARAQGGPQGPGPQGPKGGPQGPGP